MLIIDWRISNNSTLKIYVINNNGTFKCVDNRESLIDISSSIFKWWCWNNELFNKENSGRHSQRSITKWCASSMKISLNMSFRVREFIFFFHGSFNRNFGHEKMSIVVSMLLGRLSNKLETVSWFCFVRIYSKWNALIAPWTSFSWYIFEFWSAKKDRAFSMIRAMRLATEPSFLQIYYRLHPSPIAS